MANKKTVPAEIKETAAKVSEKPAEVKTAPEVKPAEAKTEAAPKQVAETEKKKPGRKPAAKKDSAVKAEKKTEAKKPGRKPAAKKDEAPKAEKAAETEKKKPGRKPAAKKTAAASKTAAPKAAKKTETAKPAAKRGRKPAAKVEEKPAPAKRGKKQLSYEEIVEAARKKAAAANITRIKFQIAANIVLTGNFSENANAAEDKNKNQFYIVVDPEAESVYVEPYRYDSYNVQITVDAEELMKVLKGKKNIYDTLSDGEIHVDGIAKQAILFINSVL